MRVPNLAPYLALFVTSTLACGGPTPKTGANGGAHGMAGKGGPGSGGDVGPAGSAGSNGSVGIGGSTAVGGSSGVFACTPGVQQLVITDCGYPYASSNPLTSTVFNESEVLRAIQPSGSWPNGVVSMFYNDEHALTMGVRSVVVTSASGSTTTDYPVSPLAASPSSVTNPQTGTNLLTGDQSGLDSSLRPMWPALFITDISSNSSSKLGDWQQGGKPISPNAVFGTWKAAVRTVDKTVSPPTVTITPDPDPAKNNWDLAGGLTPPTGQKNEGFGAEARWNVSLVPGHSYRLQVIVHDGDQNKVGGDSGEACVLFCAGGSCPPEGCDPTGTYDGGRPDGGCFYDDDGCPGTPVCPAGITPCGGSQSVMCPGSYVCANGCCLPITPG